jgi:hypothetical protein
MGGNINVGTEWRVAREYANPPSGSKTTNVAACAFNQEDWSSTMLRKVSKLLSNLRCIFPEESSYSPTSECYISQLPGSARTHTVELPRRLSDVSSKILTMHLIRDLRSLLFSKEEKPRQLRQSTLIYCASWKHRHHIKGSLAAALFNNKPPSVPEWIVERLTLTGSTRHLPPFSSLHNSFLAGTMADEQILISTTANHSTNC